MPIPFLSLKEQHEDIRPLLVEAAERVIASGIYINGPEAAALASRLSALTGKPYAVPVSNGLDAIRLILRGYIEMGKLQPGDEVILPAHTYIASLLPVVEFGLVPVLAAPDLSTFGLDWQSALQLVTDKTRALLTVHLYGTPSWDFEVARRLKERGILLIEDNAQSIGADILNPLTGGYVMTGALGDASAFSFYPTKNVGALGDAGAVVTGDEDLASTVKALANYGSTSRYHNDFTGYNCRMDELQAAFLNVKLDRISLVNEARRERAGLYDALITNPAVRRPRVLDGMHQVWHQYVVRVPGRDGLRAFLAENGIPTDVHYPLSLFDQKCFAGPGAALEDRAGVKEMARKLASEVLSLPIAAISHRDMEKTAELINKYKGKGNGE